MTGRPGVGVSGIVIRDGRVLVGRRLSGHGAGTWQFPGGKLDFGESLEDCARREVAEETGVRMSQPAVGPSVSDVFRKEHLHYITVFMVGEYVSGKPQALEPTKAADWDWYYWDDIPKPYFAPIGSLLATGFRPEGL